MSDDFDFEDAMMLGTGYALMRHGQDRQAEQIAEALRAANQKHDVDDVINAPSDSGQTEPINNLDYTSETMPEWDSYIGQEPLKRQLHVAITSAKIRKSRFPHTLLASGYPGVGKTTAARLIAQTMGVRMIELVPPFKIDTLVAAAEDLGDHDILFIDEIHKLTDGVGARGAEILLKVLEDGVAYLPDGDVVQFADISIIGATTDRDKLPEPVVDRFKLKPYFQPYSVLDLDRITVVFTYKHHAEKHVTDDTGLAIAEACRGTPRIIEEMVMAARDLALVNGEPPTPEELLDFLEVEPDGLTRVHIDYLTALRKFFAREDRYGNVEYIVGEPAMMQILRETKQGLGRIERFLVERGLIDRTPRGRRLTEAGIDRADEFIATGKGVKSNV